MDAETTGIAVSSGALGALCGVATAWIKARFGKTKIPQPLETSEKPRYVTCEQCQQHRDAIGKRIDDIGPALGRVFKKLDENDKKAEERAIKTHQRLDPLIQEIGVLHGKVEIFEKAAAEAVIGGKK